MYKEETRPALWLLDRKKELPDLQKKAVSSGLHYGDTIEISFVRGIEGETIINGNRFVYKEKNVFFIPPKYLHTSIYRTGGSKETDMICAFHINIEGLSPILNLNTLLLKDGHTLYDLAFYCENFDELWTITQLILDENRSFIARTADLLRLFEIIAAQKSPAAQSVAFNKPLLGVLDYVEENFHRHLNTREVAAHIGYTEHYFCKWFKENTGITFNLFLNTVRISHACICLSNGCTIEQTAQLCGFSDPSYFAKVFKKHKNITPKAYSMIPQKGAQFHP